MGTALLILPNFVLILLGLALARAFDYGRAFWSGLEKLVYYVLFPGLTEKIFLARDNTIYHLYQSRYGINVLRTDERLRAVLASAEDARLIGVEAGAPLLEVRRVALTFRDRPVELRISRVNTARHDYHNTLGKEV